MKLKFIFLTLLLLFARGCDFYSTSLWYFDSPGDEANPLASIPGLGWTGLLITNLIVIGIVIYAYYHYAFRHPAARLSHRPGKLTDFVSEWYFGEEGKFYQIFYRMPKDKRLWIAHSGYVLIRVLIVASFLATAHNLCQFYELPAYDSFRAIVKRPLYFVYGLIMLSMVYFSYRLWQKEFEMARKAFAPNPPADGGGTHLPH